MTQQTLQSSNAAFPLQPLHLLDEVSHRVANEYAEAIATLRLAALDAGDSRTGAAIWWITKRLRAYADTHRALFAPTSEGQIDLGDYVGNVCATMTEASLAPLGVGLLLDTEEIWLDSGRSWRVGLIVAELIRNATQHGLVGGQGVVRVSIAQACGWVRCQVSDNGGLTDDLQPGRGWKLVETLAAELGGAADWWFTPTGCHTRLTIPMAAAPVRS